ncbi:class II fructose-bisphosphate aldolase [Streptomyces bohaiensis]|uniref:Ketose-bisphosphate aldolase n=1 Tax=Streptomyces bohaiensis TaxID=1431344 RepID=A0ABX1CBL1_9ACTN|nr:ketose-bisphosphate aldolase [Streptomyces bohaiensis]NJQ16500.1 ketose-bisphosphate aldolase [Streptomyces bohaiensis]
MPLVAAGGLLTAARERRGAVAAFNVITLEHVEAVLEGAERAGVPVILQISENAVRYRRADPLPLARAATAAAEAAAVPAALHLDHVRDPELLRRAAEAGCSSVMVDASHLPYRDNLAACAAAARWARANGLWTEAELGVVGGKDGEPPPDPHHPEARTDPEAARAFTAASGVDALAVAIGSRHAMTTPVAALDHALLARLAERVPVPLVLHGSSGVPAAELAAAVRGGITKVNIGTALNVALTTGVRAALVGDTEVVDPRRWLADGRSAMAATAARLAALVHRPPPGPEAPRPAPPVARPHPTPHPPARGSDEEPP